jgi:alcohol dehydrogenase class IV
LNAIILPHVLRFNEPTASEKYPRLRRALGLEQGADVAAVIENLNRRIGLPTTLGALGVTTAHMPELVAHATADIAAATNPRPVSEDDYRDLFALAIG